MDMIGNRKHFFDQLLRIHLRKDEVEVRRQTINIAYARPIEVPNLINILTRRNI